MTEADDRYEEALSFVSGTRFYDENWSEWAASKRGSDAAARTQKVWEETGVVPTSRQFAQLVYDLASSKEKKSEAIE